MLTRLFPVTGLILLGSLHAGAQATMVPPTTTTAEVQAAPIVGAAQQQREMIFKYTEQKPAFKGNLVSYLSSQMKYPDAALKAGIQGKVFLSFVVTDKGLVEHVEVVRSSGDASLDAEAVRVIKGMNNPDGGAMWVPAKNNGVPVNCYYTQPVSFKMG